MARALYTLAYPSLSSADRQMIDDFRALHDLPYKDVVAPHFTIGFGCEDVAAESYTSHVELVCRQSHPIAFHCRYAMFMADPESGVAHVFLVPDEGYAAISLLHDRFYTGLMQPSHRLEIPYVPHIGIATLSDQAAIKCLCDELNASGVSIPGTIDELTVGALEERIEDVAAFPLSGRQDDSAGR